MSRMVGTVSRGVRAPIIRNGDNLVEIVTDSVLEAAKDAGFKIQDRDIVAMTEAIVARAQGNYASVDNIADDVRAKLGGETVGVIFPILLIIQQAGRWKKYEFVPLGRFTAERPKAPDVIQIDLTCYDLMQKFDVDMPSDAALWLSYPLPLKTLFEYMCWYVGVDYVSSDFINSTATIDSRPADFDSVTMREVIKWIAEAAGSNARFNRDGKLELAWLRQTGRSYNANAYREFNPYWYETKKVTKLYNRSTQDAEDKTVGDGNEAYLIQDNPLLRGVR